MMKLPLPWRTVVAVAIVLPILGASAECSAEGNKNYRVSHEYAHRLTADLNALPVTFGPNEGPNRDVDIHTFRAVTQRIITNYVDPVDPETLYAGGMAYLRTRLDGDNPPAHTKGDIIRTVIDGMLRQLDPYSVFLNTEENLAFEESIRGEYAGLGIEISKVEQGIKVNYVIPDGPSKRAGLRENDIILTTNDADMAQTTLVEAIGILRGKSGTLARLSVLRGAQVLGFAVTREIIRINPVRVSLEGDIGVLRLSTFNHNTIGGVVAGMEKLRRMVSPGELRGLVLDLRNNQGGALNQSILVSDFFLKEGVVVYTEDRNRNRLYSRSLRPDQTSGLPLVALINRNTASASEILAGALRDHNRAVLVGERSFGKGVVQLRYSLNNGMGLKLTAQMYFTPLGIKVDDGITPDLEALDKPETEQDEQLITALNAVLDLPTM